MPHQRLPPLLAVGVAVIAFGWLNHVNPEFAITSDGVRDQLLARDCVDLGRCHLVGVRTSVPGVYQGAAWLDLLVAVRLAGGDAATTRTVVLTFLALSVGTAFLIVWRWLRPSLALPTAFILLGGLSLDTYPSQLINPSVSVFPDVLTAAALLCYGLSSQHRYLIFSAFALGLAINVHVASATLVPSLLAVIALVDRRPLRPLLVALGILAATYVVTSRAALIANLDEVISRGRLLPLLAGLASVTLLSAWLGPWFRRRSYGTRSWFIGFVLVLPFAAGSLWLILLQQQHFTVFYLHPVLAPAAALAAAIISAPFESLPWGRNVLSWMPATASVAGAALIPFLHRPAPQSAQRWTFAEATAIAKRATQMGLTWEQLLYRIQSRGCRELLLGMSVEAAPPTSTHGGNRKHLQVLRASRDQVATLPGPHDVVALEDGEVAVIREIDSWLQPEALIACRVPVEPTGPPVCVHARDIRSESGNLTAGLFLARAYPEAHEIDLPPPYVARYEIPLSPAAGESRDIALNDDTSPECGWSITHARNVRVEGQLPARHARLHSDTGAPGLLVLERTFGTGACASADWRYPPCVMETPPGDPLGAIVEGR